VNKLGKYGLKGNSGIGKWGANIVHINAPYDANGMVFVDHKDHWKRMRLSTAKKRKKEIILCSDCKKPAVRLDHLYPYHSEMNACATHAKL
jgi:hypothetical protein